MFAYPLDQMIGGIFYEHSHRMIASVVGFLTIIVAVWLWKREERKWVRVLGFVALTSVIAQGILGGLTVRFLLPTAISVSHATLAQTFFAIMATLALVTSSWWRSEQRPLNNDSGSSLVRLSIITTIAVYIQLILGALMRHTQSGLAVPDFPLAYGQLFPSLTSASLEQYNQQLIQSDIRLAADGAITSTQILIHMLHRLWAIGVSVMVVWTSIRLFNMSAASKRLFRFAFILLGMLILQITLGGLTVLSVKAVDITTAHVATGALLLVTCVLMSLYTIKIFGIRSQQPAIAFSAREVTA
jgi:cytochrome c oxidase assembly protein subunit 15